MNVAPRENSQNEIKIRSFFNNLLGVLSLIDVQGTLRVGVKVLSQNFNTVYIKMQQMIEIVSPLQKY